MTLEQISNLTVEDVEFILKARIRFDQDDEEYEPSQAELDAELVTYKQELTDAENARLAEEARIQDLKDRYAAIGREAAQANGMSNPDAYFRDAILKNSDHAAAEAVMAAMEAEKAAYDAAQLPLQRESKLSKLRDKRNSLLTEADHEVNKKEDASEDASALRAYRQSLRDVTDAYKDENGDASSAVDALDVDSFVFPTKP